MTEESEMFRFHTVGLRINHLPRVIWRLVYYAYIDVTDRILKGSLLRLKQGVESKICRNFHRC